jgi:predicted aldo/keto reductase-like oxidoreductase
MQYKTYGTTGKKVSIISFGGMRLPHPENIEEGAELVAYAHSKGINYFDTAPGYCADKSEENVGAALKRMKRDSFHVSTKCLAADGAQVRKSLERSLKRLNVERIDFFHIWGVMSLEAWEKRKAGGAVAAAHKAREEGLIGHVVTSSHMSGKDIRMMLHDGLVEGVTLGYCAINFPYRDDAVEAAREMNLGVVTMNPLGGGVIPQNPGRLSFLKGPDDASVVAAALRFNVSHPGITTALVGFSAKQHVDEAVAAVENFQPYSQARIDEIRRHILRSFDDLCTGCGYCLPCPEKIQVPQMMDTFNQRLLVGAGQKALRDRLKWHWANSPEEAAQCTECGACEDRCTQHLPIRERMKVIAALVEEKK